MTGDLVRDPSPEEQELQQKRAELAALKVRLAERELELATFQAELQTFKHLYLKIVGVKIQELQRLHAQIEEYTDLLAAQPSPDAGELKQLYRQLAKAIHPDFATDPEERERREALMAEVNQAYEREDIERLKALLEAWANGPDAIKGEDVAAQLLRILRKITQSQLRLANIEQQIRELENTDEYRLQRRAQQAQEVGRDLLSEKVQALDQKIQAAQARLDELKKQAD
ncbi:MAG: hypothetical protein MH252_13380 [Thermosynechococcaceae cyanobacterium MS004]|nr:hypothetical protein [Thermosynechococcaceae cyanobacterium MS004]